MPLTLLDEEIPQIRAGPGLAVFIPHLAGQADGLAVVGDGLFEPALALEEAGQQQREIDGSGQVAGPPGGVHGLVQNAVPGFPVAAPLHVGGEGRDQGAGQGPGLLDFKGEVNSPDQAGPLLVQGGHVGCLDGRVIVPVADIEQNAAPEEVGAALLIG
ncbi:MAG TPA: hypothetical protein VGD99_20890 [Anaerolineae bacterium]